MLGALIATVCISVLAPVGARASATGGVRAWGSNNFGQLGLESGAADGLPEGNPTNNARVASPVPLPVKAFVGLSINDLAAGTYHSLAVKSDATVATWGDNSSGQLGNGCVLPCGRGNTPVVVSGLNSVLDVAGGGRHSLAVKDNGTADQVWAWGSDASGQLGDGCNLSVTTVTASDYCGSESTPLQVRTNAMATPDSPTYLTGATAVVAGGRHSVALKSDGTVWSWGDNTFGQLGNATTTSSTFAVQVKTGAGTNLTGVTAIAAGGQHSLALKSDGTVWAWGANDAGQLGNDSIIDSNVAVQVRTGPATNLTGVVSIAAGSAHSLAVKDEAADTVWAWGANESGQLGDTTTDHRDVAVQVKTGPTTSLAGVLAVSAGGLHSLAIIDGGLAGTNDDAVWSWGRNLEGQLGHGTTGAGLIAAANSNLAGPVVGLAGATRVAGGGLHSLAFVP